MGKDFPDLRRALILGLPAKINGQIVRIGTQDVTLSGVTVGEAPTSVIEAAAVNGFIAVETIDSQESGTTRRTTVVVDVYATTQDRMAAIAERTGGILRDETQIGGVILDRFNTRSGPKRVPWDNSKIRKSSATYVISTRR